MFSRLQPELLQNPEPQEQRRSLQVRNLHIWAGCSRSRGSLGNLGHISIVWAPEA